MVVVPVMEMAAMYGHAKVGFASWVSIWELRSGMLFRADEDNHSMGKNKGGEGFLEYLRDAR